MEKAKRKARALQKELARRLEDCEVDYVFSDAVHKFMLKCSMPHWLYVENAYVADRSEEELIDALTALRIVEVLRTSRQSRWLSLGRSGVREVMRMGP